MDESDDSDATESDDAEDTGDVGEEEWIEKRHAPAWKDLHNDFASVLEHTTA